VINLCRGVVGRQHDIPDDSVVASPETDSQEKIDHELTNPAFDLRLENPQQKGCGKYYHDEGEWILGKQTH
jgi:hypothetical protein